MEIRIGNKIEFYYINYKSETGYRKAEVKEIYFGSTSFHPRGQWLMRGFDLDKNEERIYAINDMMNFTKLAEGEY